MKLKAAVKIWEMVATTKVKNERHWKKKKKSEQEHVRPGWIKVRRWNERVRAKRCDAVDWDQIMENRLKRRGSERWGISLKGFVNRLSHDCHVDVDRNVSTESRSSSLFKLFNNRRKSGRTKNILRHGHRHKLSLFYHEEHRSRNSLKCSR